MDLAGVDGPGLTGADEHSNFFHGKRKSDLIIRTRRLTEANNQTTIKQSKREKKRRQGQAPGTRNSIILHDVHNISGPCWNLRHVLRTVSFAGFLWPSFLHARCPSSMLSPFSF